MFKQIILIHPCEIIICNKTYFVRAARVKGSHILLLLIPPGGQSTNVEFMKSLSESERDEFPLYTSVTDSVDDTFCDIDQNGEREREKCFI